MGTFDVVDAIAGLPLLKYVGVVDFFDKLNFIATCIMLIACSLIVTLREYVMDPISCYMSHTPGGENMLKFIEHYCWVQGTMTISDHKVPQTENDWKLFEQSRLVYYQWVPFMLLFQAALFHTPRILWSIFTFNMTGTNVQDIVEKACDTTKEGCENKIERLAARLEYMLVEHREYRKGCFHDFKRNLYRHLPLCVVGKRFANWLTFGYLFTKILYLVNSIGQIYLMQAFLQLHNHRDYSSNFGMEIAKNIINGRNWEITSVFPRVTYCMARVKQLGSMNTVTAQCVLTANLFIEKIYIVLWFWIVIVSIFTAFSFVTWVFRFVIPSRYCSEIKKHLKLGSQEVLSVDHIEGFCNEFLRLDGIFVLRIITINAGDIVATPLVSHLYKLYVDKYSDKKFTKYDDFSNIKETLKLINQKDNDCSSPYDT